MRLLSCVPAPSSLHHTHVLHSPAPSSREEQEWLLFCSKELGARETLRWDPAVESGALLCEELRADRLALAGPCVSEMCCVCMRVCVCVCMCGA